MKRKYVFGILAVIIFAIAFVAWKFFGPTVSTPTGEFFYIKTGSSYSDVRNALVHEKFLSGPFWFDKASDILKYKNVRPGRYKLDKGMSVFELVRMLRNGRQSKVNFVITKIRTRETLAARAGRLFEPDSAQFMQFISNPDSLRPFGLDTNTVMAVAMPLTYSLNWNTTPGKVFREWEKAWKNFWTEERKAKATKLGLTPLQVSTMASIIEEETNKKSDKPNIASVYLNRIHKGMPLQADPTVKFALKNFELKRIYQGHTQTNSPFNTYVNKGLPPGPICTPSLESLEAVLDTPTTDYLYFVANSSFDGTHVFTTNYDEHLKYARLYQQQLDIEMKKRDSLKALESK